MSLGSWLHSLKSALASNRSQGRGRGRAATHRPNLEVLEDRTLPSTFTVLNLADSGAGSLRQAVLDANDNPGADLIEFAGGFQGTIPLSSELSITDDLIIHGDGENRLTVSGNKSRGCLASAAAQRTLKSLV